MAAAAQTRQGEYLLLQAALPGRPVQTIGVLLHDPAGNQLGLRLRRDWDFVADSDEEEVLSGLAEQMETHIAEWGAVRSLRIWEESLSNSVRLSERRPVMLGDFGKTLNLLYREHVPANVRPFLTHLPVYSCRAAAGRWGEQSQVEAEGWIETPEEMRLADDMFVARVVGRSMEPEIGDGSWCVFRAGVTGSRQGRRVLVENYTQSESGGERYTVKRYKSEKKQEADGTWAHTRIVLEPLNPEFEPWELEEGTQCRVIAEFVQVLES